jgi:hypothetical protein
MTFIQIIELRTQDIRSIRKTADQYRQDTEGKRTIRRELLTRDRNDPGRYFAIVFFDSHESAMENSGLPETQASAEQFKVLMEAPPAYYDLDVIDDRT